MRRMGGRGEGGSEECKSARVKKSVKGQSEK